ncbi:MAG: LuxR C-terminal-related transcriptional regulator [Opitutaceae bacterium]
MLTQVLIVKWDGLYARLLADAVRAYYPMAKIVVEHSAHDAKRRIEAQGQDLVVSGLSYADEDGLPLLPWMVESPRVAALLLVTLRRDAQTLGFLRLQRRVSVFDPVTDAPERFALALAHAAQGRRYVSPSFNDLLLGGEEAQLDLFARLTPTERMVLAVIGDGSDDKTASERLGMEPSSVHSHRKRLMRKLDVQTRESLFRRALELGVVRILPDGRTSRPGFDVLRSQIESRKRTLDARRSERCAGDKRPLRFVAPQRASA